MQPHELAGQVVRGRNLATGGRQWCRTVHWFTRLSLQRQEIALCRGLPYPTRASRNSQACSVFCSSVATVIGPTPPGTGVIQLACSAAEA